ncbi:MAG: cobalamin-binding protein [Halomonadaceae bacterium]|nr:MAG: cobalamin-binding protein [Halomonadaceae bacterium]
MRAAQHRHPTLSRLLPALAAVVMGLCAGPLLAKEVCVTDDADREVCLAQPAQRVLPLSPGATELAFSAGAGDQVIAGVSYSDYPPEARELPSVGSHTRLDMEKLMSMEPDLLIVWATGNPREQTDRLEELGLTLYFTEATNFEQIASNIERLSLLTGTHEAGHKEAKRFRDGIESIRQQYQDADPVPLFYQVWDEPLMTINQHHFIHEVVNLCRGDNVFADLSRRVPRIGKESVLEANPEAIVAGGMGEENRQWLEDWKGFSNLTAVQQGNLFFVPPSIIQRPTTRLLAGAENLCEHLETARERR